MISICSNGFDKSESSERTLGTGESFTRDPSLSVHRCQGGRYMLVCRLTLGKESSTSSNADGDHIWLAEKGCYVIKEPEQVLPQYIIKFSGGDCIGTSNLRPTKMELLEDILSSQGKWSSKVKEAIKPVPRQRECL